MKIKYIPLLMIAFAMTLGACDSDSDDGDGNGNGNGNFAVGKMEAKIDGVQWDATSATASTVSAGGFFTLTIAGAKAVNNSTSADALIIAFFNDTGAFSTGTYTIGQSPLASMSFIDGSDLSKSFLATSGTVTITKINDDEVEGTFSFEAMLGDQSASITVTSGSFDVPFSFSF